MCALISASDEDDQIKSWLANFEEVNYRVITDPEGSDDKVRTEATIKVWLQPEDGQGARVRVIATGEGNGPVNALDAAFRIAVGNRFPQLRHVHLTDYKVRVLDSAKGTGARTRVLIDSSDGERTWTTIGVSDNVIEASWEALSDSIVFALLHSPA